MTIKIKKWLSDLSRKWIKFWNKKWSVIVKDYTDTIYRDIYSIEDTTNLFMSINWYKHNAKDRTTKNINQINAFFLDIDLDQNEWESKESIYNSIMEYKEDFDFIVESYAGYHCYILIDWNKYKDDEWNIDFESYKKDWKETREYYNKIMELRWDLGAIKTSQVWRLVSSFHQKKETQKKFKIKLLKWESLLKESVIEQINKIPITKVLDKLWIKYNSETLKLYHENEETTWRSIYVKWNSITNFSTHKVRNQGWCFAFVYNYYKQKNGSLDIKWNSINTYKFFEDNFWIQSKNDIWENIRLNKLISINLLKNWYSEEQLKYYLYLQYYATNKRLIDWETSDRVDISELKEFIWNNDLKYSTIIKNLEELNEKSTITITSREKCIIKNMKLIDIQFKKEWLTKINFSILPNINQISHKIQSKKYFHYFNKNILKLASNNNKLIELYLYLHKELILKKKKTVLLKNETINNFKINKNPSLRNKILNNFCNTLNDFQVLKKWKEWFEFINPRI